MSFLGLDRSRRELRLSLYLVIVCGLVSICALVVSAAETSSLSEDGYLHAVKALEDSISLLKWVGGAIITGLVSGIGLLYRSLEKANATIRDDLMQGLQHRAELMTAAIETQTKLTARVDELACKMESLASTLARNSSSYKSSEGK